MAGKLISTGGKNLVKGSRGAAVKAAIPTKQDKIMNLVNAGKRDEAKAEYGAQAVRQAESRANKARPAELKKAAKEEAKTIEKINKSGAGTSRTMKKEKTSKQRKAENAYRRIQEANSKAKVVQSVDDFIKAGGKIEKVPAEKAAVYRAEMEMELKGKTSRAARNRIKDATIKKKARQAKKLTQGRESDADFEARMALEARKGGVEDVGRRRSQRGSAPDPMYDYERSQAESFIRGRNKPEMGEDEYSDFIKELSGVLGFKKGGKIKKQSTARLRGVGKALRGYGKAMKGKY